VGPQARFVRDALEFRTPAMLKAVEPLSDAAFRWQPPNGANPVAWLLWHIAEVEDNWVRDRLYGLPKRYPFGVSVKSPGAPKWPRKSELVGYFHEVRTITRARLEQTSEPEFDRLVEDEHYGTITVRQLRGGVVTSGAWHGGQIVLIAARLAAGQ
jgi:uncharacterized damage-inducible protein DinB